LKVTSTILQEMLGSVKGRLASQSCTLSLLHPPELHPPLLWHPLGLPSLVPHELHPITIYLTGEQTFSSGRFKFLDEQPWGLWKLQLAD
jgi:hypothetical protein